MSNKQVSVVEAFGQFAVQIGDEVVLYPTEATALAAGTIALKGQLFKEEAENYCASLDLSQKQEKTQTNIIVNFLAWKETSTDEDDTISEVSLDEDEHSNSDIL